MSRFVNVLVVLLAAGCTARSEPELSRIDAYPDILAHHGLPAAAEDWSFVPFSDQGSWQGFALPPPGSDGELGAGFIGPFLFAEGRWLGPRLARLVVRGSEESRPLDFSAPRASSVPGALRQSGSLGSLGVDLTLWFHSQDTALVVARFRNPADQESRIHLEWVGSVFEQMGRLEASDAGVLAESTTSSMVRITVDRPARTAMISGEGYRLALEEPLEIPARGEASVALALTYTLGGDRSPDPAGISSALGDPQASYTANEARWNRYLTAIDTGRAAHDPVQILSVKALQTLINNWRGPAGRLRHGGLFPSSNVWYFNGFWAWDSWKQAVALARFEPDLAAEQLYAMFDHQDETGMIADVVYLDASEDNWRDTKPPLAGWALESVYEASDDLELVRALYPKLVAYHGFWYADRDHDGDGLCEYGSTDGTLVAARWESGMDNAVRFDRTRMLQNGTAAWSMNQESVDLNSYLYREKIALANLARALARPDEAEHWSSAARSLADRIRTEMFDQATGWFYDIAIDGGAIVPVQGPEGWIPLWTGVASAAQAARVRETLLDPDKFRTFVPFPTVARDDPGFSDGYWRGLVWLDQAHFAIQGLRRYGFSSDANELTRQLLDHLEGATVPGAALRENYHPLTGAGQNVSHFSWTAAHLLQLGLELEP